MDWEVAGQNGEDGATKSPKRKGRKMKKWAVALLVIAVIVELYQESAEEPGMADFGPSDAAS